MLAGAAAHLKFVELVTKFICNAGTTKHKNMVGSILRRLNIKMLPLLQRSAGSAIVPYRRVCQKEASRKGA